MSDDVPLDVQHSTLADGDTSDSQSVTRRRALQALASLGIGTTIFHRAVAAQVSKETSVSAEMIQQAEWISGIELTEDERKAAASRVNRAIRNYQFLRTIKLDNSVPPAIAFNPAPWLSPAPAGDRGSCRPIENAAGQRPRTDDDLAFLPVTELSAQLRTRQVSSMELTKLYLDRLKKFDPVLKCIVTLTEELAMKQATQADREIAAGRYRGPLHGIPWGAKDLISYPGYLTTWGAEPYQDQMLDTKASVAKRLENAGAVLVAKLSLGALASGDRWFRGQTRNPWNPKQGSSGSSAGPAAATAAGLSGFSIGSETHGSIVSPCRRCGCSGLRPTFGRVSRHGCMTLSWSMDKLGPICRSVEDCALVFGAIHGWDGLDMSAVDRPFHWPMQRDLRSLRVGYVERKNAPADEREDLKILRGLGVKLVPITLPDIPPYPLLMILYTEAGTAFDELTRADDVPNNWGSSFSSAQFVPAVEYLRANRVRTLMMQEMKQVMTQVDCYVGGNDLTLTNLTGHPTVVMPNGFRKLNSGVEVPLSITFTGQLYGETEVLALAHAFQQETGFHLKRPNMSKLVEVEAAKATKG